MAKVVVRHLPPTLPEAVFWGACEPALAGATVEWRSYVAGRAQRERGGKEAIDSRAYIKFTSDQAVVDFNAAFNGHVFQDKAGVQSVAQVELAPFPRIPTARPKRDPTQGTIATDADYAAFVKQLSEPKPAEAAASTAGEGGVICACRLLQDDPDMPASVTPGSIGPASGSKAPQTTPLLEHLKAVHAAAATSKGKGKAPVKGKKAAPPNVAEPKSQIRKDAPAPAVPPPMPSGSVTPSPVVDKPARPGQAGASRIEREASRRLLGGVLGPAVTRRGKADRQPSASSPLAASSTPAPQVPAAPTPAPAAPAAPAPTRQGPDGARGGGRGRGRGGRGRGRARGGGAAPAPSAS